MVRRDDGSGSVYSTDHGRMCPGCARPLAECACRDRAAGAVPQGDGVVRVARSTKGRKGKAVTLITGVPLAAAELADLAKRLKRRCGAGGSVKDGAIEVQGDHRDALVAALESEGYTVKRSGG